jgi:hypothetical protein
MVMKRWAVLIAALPLSGCFDDQRTQVGKCQYEAQRILPTQQLESSSQLGGLIIACMRASGYEYTMHQSKCTVGLTTEINPYCYRPIRGGNELWFDIEMALGR